MTCVKIFGSLGGGAPMLALARCQGFRSHAQAGVWIPGGVRKATLSRFHPLIATMAIDSSTISASLNCARTSSYTASDTCDCSRRVRASV